MKEPSVKHIALLIDVENMRTANPKECLQAMLTELLRNGELVVKRAYGDFSNDATVQSWESVLRAETWFDSRVFPKNFSEVGFSFRF
jgi:hypothetical protein